ncbi:MAG: CPBP family intramembrane glutamic endopeptidase [Syntrophobacteraceae bacterium]
MIIFFFVPKNQNLSFPVYAFSAIFRDLALTSFVVFSLWRNGEPLTLIGWKSSGLKREVTLGVCLFFPVLVIAWLVKRAFQDLGLTTMRQLPHFLTAKSPWEMLLLCLLLTVAVVTEETVFRGYLILRFYELTARLGPSVIISTAVFTLGHGYEGPAGTGTVGVLGLILALIYLWRKSLIAPMVIHFLVDFIPLLLMPLIKRFG